MCISVMDNYFKYGLKCASAAKSPGKEKVKRVGEGAKYGIGFLSA